jgi:two-component system CheB/CheR fusion protein
VVVQEPQSAKYSGMPESAIATGLADYIVPAEDIPARLLQYAKGLPLGETSAAAAQRDSWAPSMARIIALL